MERRIHGLMDRQTQKLKQFLILQIYGVDFGESVSFLMSFNFNRLMSTVKALDKTYVVYFLKNNFSVEPLHEGHTCSDQGF